jgi:hypothetical protein
MIRLFKKSVASNCTEAADSLVKDGLSLTAGDKLVLLYQRELDDVAQHIISVAKAKKILLDVKQFDVTEFYNEYPASCSIPNLAVEPIPTGIVLLMEWSEKSTQARLALLRDLVDVHKGWRIASMPGVDISNFGLCVSDFTEITDKCELTFASLERSTLAILETPNPDGNIDILRIPIGAYPPQNSTGKIARDTWGNFPSGETFVVPNPYQAEGWVTVRGSIPKRPLQRSEWVRYEVQDGRIGYHSIVASSSDLANDFKSLCFNQHGHPKDENTNALAELGIGTNASITRLTGNPIFDEKQLGTVHIAFGRNDQFKGPLVSSVHHDIVCTNATLILDHRFDFPTHGSITLVANGTFVGTRAVAVPELDSFPEYHQEMATVGFGKTEFSFQNVGPDASGTAKMTIEYVSERENVQLVIASGKSAEIAHIVLVNMSEVEASSADSIVRTFQGIEAVLCRRIITGLLVYGVLDANTEQ